MVAAGISVRSAWPQCLSPSYLKTPMIVISISILSSLFPIPKMAFFSMNFESNQTELLRQIQLGLNAFWLMHRFSGQSDSTSSSSSGIFPTFPTQFLTNSPVKSQPAGKGENVEKDMIEKEDEEPPRLSPKQKCREEEKKMERGIVEGEEEEEQQIMVSSASTIRPPVLDKRWEFVCFVKSFAEFEQLRCLHQVSRNRTFAYGIRYSCTQKTQIRSNCPYLLVCIFAGGAGEHSPKGVGKITVYSRNKHTHTVKTIKKRQPRSVAIQAKRERVERKEEMNGKQRKNEEKTMEMNATINKIEENNEDEIQILEPEIKNQKCMPTSSHSFSSNLACQNPIMSEGNKDERQNKLMDLLAELSQHFASSAKESKTFKEE